MHLCLLWQRKQLGYIKYSVFQNNNDSLKIKLHSSLVIDFWTIRSLWKYNYTIIRYDRG